jgi:hypothetical protein
MWWSAGLGKGNSRGSGSGMLLEIYHKNELQHQLQENMQQKTAVEERKETLLNSPSFWKKKIFFRKKKKKTCFFFNLKKFLTCLVLSSAVN